MANNTIYVEWLSLLTINYYFVIISHLIQRYFSGVDKLYGFLIWKSNYCFICTWYYSNTTRSTGKRYFIFIGFVILVYKYLWKKIKIGEVCLNVTAVKDKIYIGGKRIVVILNTDGSRVREITTDACYKFNIVYNDKNGQLLLREMRTLRCINLDGHLIYRYTVSGGLGLTVDRQDYVYLCTATPFSCPYLFVLSFGSGVDKLYGFLLWKSNYCFFCTWYYSNTPRFTGKPYFIFIGFAIPVYIYL
jgi:hypothetical protein